MDVLQENVLKCGMSGLKQWGSCVKNGFLSFSNAQDPECFPALPVLQYGHQEQKEVPHMWFTVLSLAVIGGAMCVNR